MEDVFDMAASITRGEFHEAVALLATKRELRDEIQVAVAPLATKAELQEAVAKLATKRELEAWGTVLADRMDRKFDLVWREMGDMRQEMTGMRQEMTDIRQEMKDMRQELQTDLARHANAIHESVQSMIRALDDKYSGLPRPPKGKRTPRG